MIMSQEVEQREDDGEWFLHAEETVERPFAVELEDWLAVGRFASEAFVGDDVLAGVVAFGGTVPEEETMLECWSNMSFCCCMVLVYSLVACSFLFLDLGGYGSRLTDCRAANRAVSRCAYL